MKSFPAFGILFGSPSRLSQLRKLLEENSGLPGPRANLELAFSFATAAAGMHLQEWQWQFLVDTAATPPAEAAENTPKVFPCLCAVLAMAALYATGLPRPRRRQALAAFAAAAGDHRWRMREAAAMALQHVGEEDPAELQTIVEDWMPGASFYALRGVAAALAHPPLLKDPAFAAWTMGKAREIVGAAAAAGPGTRKSEGFKVLRQGLGYSLSVFTAAAPKEGFALLKKMAADPDPDIAWIVKENLSKHRIAGAFEKECAEVARIAEATSTGEAARPRRARAPQ